MAVQDGELAFARRLVALSAASLERQRNVLKCLEDENLPSELARKLMHTCEELLAAQEKQLALMVGRKGKTLQDLRRASGCS